LAEELETVRFPAAGLERHALVRPSPESGLPPVAFVFHGRGGTAEGAAASIPLHEAFPEAMIVYPQGVPGQKAMRDPEGRRSSWQRMPGELDDRDVLFFDAALEILAERHRLDPTRVYLLGQSNGGRFANLLWNQRGMRIAALCSAGSQGGRLIAEAPPRPVLMVIGEKDRVAPRDGQEKSVALARARLGTDPQTMWADGLLRSESGPDGLELATWIHPGGHEFPRAALPVVADFFRRHALPAA
jgi:polyhydroxybutyrate depolymerase